MIYNKLIRYELLALIVVALGFFIGFDTVQLVAYGLVLFCCVADMTINRKTNNILIYGQLGAVGLLMCGCVLSFFSIGPYQIICMTAIYINIIAVGISMLLIIFQNAELKDIWRGVVPISVIKHIFREDGAIPYLQVLFALLISLPQFTHYRYYKEVKYDSVSNSYKAWICDGERIEKLFYEPTKNCYVSEVTKGDTCITIHWSYWSPDSQIINSTDTVIVRHKNKPSEK
ncbi:MAG: hypothetical protein E7069_10490 [Bacteroidales bacterium]|jgi:hypothetical protein|nr:hypothetical protein [Bacteroidales bacterium]